MKEIHVDLHNIPVLEGNINACIGFFDGIHKGHQELIKRVHECSLKNGGISALITFDPDPWAIIKGIDNITHLTTMKERMEIASSLGIELWIVLNFTKEMAKLNVEAFHHDVLFPLHLNTLVCGYDFQYACHGLGNIETLRNQSDFHVEVIEQVSSEQEKISSSRIEKNILEGKVEEAEELLGRPYEIRGIVVHGLKNGRKIGFPTANLEMQEPYVCPKEGVYAGYAHVLNKTYQAVINVGKNPTFGDYHKRSIEAFMIDFEEEIYGAEIIFTFLHYQRSEVRFNSIDELVQQMKKDTKNALDYLKKREEV